MKFLAFLQIRNQNEISTAQTLKVQKSIEHQGHLIQ